MIGINLYVLCCSGRCKVTPIPRVGTTDKMDRCHILLQAGIQEIVTSTRCLLLG